MVQRSRKFLVFIFYFTFLILSISTNNLVGAQDSSKVLKASVFVNEGPETYQDYSVFSQNGNIQIDIFDDNLTNYVLTFNKANKVYFIAAYNRFVLVEQKNQTDIISYWVLIVNRTRQGFSLQSFPVNSSFDNEGHKLDTTFIKRSIIEYNEIDHILYFLFQGMKYTIVYGVNTDNQQNTFRVINYFFTNPGNPEPIVGGNSRVLVQLIDTGRLWLDQETRVNGNTDPTNYKKINIKDLTILLLYFDKNTVYTLRGSYFQYVSQTQDLLNMSTFVYHGSNQQPIRGQTAFYYYQQTKIFSDNYNFFIAVNNDNLQMTIVDYNDQTSQYELFSSTVKYYVSDVNLYYDILNDFYTAIWIVYNDKMIYLITEFKFMVYTNIDTPFRKLHQNNLSQGITEKSNLVEIMFKQIYNWQYS